MFSLITSDEKFLKVADAAFDFNFVFIALMVVFAINLTFVIIALSQNRVREALAIGALAVIAGTMGLVLFNYQNSNSTPEEAITLIEKKENVTFTLQEEEIFTDYFVEHKYENGEPLEIQNLLITGNEHDKQVTVKVEQNDDNR